MYWTDPVRQKILDAHAIIAETDIAGNITYANDKFIEISGYSKAELIGQNHRMLSSGLHKPAFFRNLWQTISSGSVWNGEIQNKAKDGSYYWVESTIAPVKDQEGTIVKYISIRTDVTLRKKIEADFLLSRKDAAITRIMSNISHNFNNLLGIISGSFEALETCTRDNEQAAFWIKTGKSGADRATAITQQLTKFSQEHMTNALSLPFHKTVADYVDILTENISDHICINSSYAEDLADFYFNKKELEESIQQLALNAQDAIKKGGTITVRTENLSLDTSLAWGNVYLQSGCYFMLEIADDGIGISPDIQNEIFDPFFTTKEFGSRSGLGLSHVQSFARRHKGQLAFFSGRNGGTIFRIFLPAQKN